MTERPRDYKRKQMADVWRLFKPTSPAQSAYIYEIILWLIAELLLVIGRLVAIWKPNIVLDWAALGLMAFVMLILLINTVRFRRFTYVRAACMLYIIIGYFVFLQ